MSGALRPLWAEQPQSRDCVLNYARIRGITPSSSPSLMSLSPCPSTSLMLGSPSQSPSLMPGSPSLPQSLSLVPGSPRCLSLSVSVSRARIPSLPQSLRLRLSCQDPLTASVTSSPSPKPGSRDQKPRVYCSLSKAGKRIIKALASSLTGGISNTFPLIYDHSKISS